MFTLRKHAYSNILKISPPKTESFQIKKIWYFSYCCSKLRLWYPLEPPRRRGSNEYPQSVFWAEIRKNVYPCKPQFYYIKVKGDQHYIGMFSRWKAPYSSKIDIFFIQERFNKLIESINTIIKCGILQPLKFQLSLSYLIWINNEMIFYCVSELILATLIQSYDNKSFHFKNERRLTEILQAVGCHKLWLY